MQRGSFYLSGNTNMHGANEFMYVEDIIKAAEIFAMVIAEVCGVEDE